MIVIDLNLTTLIVNENEKKNNFDNLIAVALASRFQWCTASTGNECRLP